MVEIYFVVSKIPSGDTSIAKSHAKLVPEVGCRGKKSPFK